jgi:hypothetical protein
LGQAAAGRRDGISLMASWSRHSEVREPLRWHWLYFPLIAYLAFAVGPSVLAPILFVLSFFVDIPVQRLADPISLVISAFFLGLTFWPFLWLYGYARDALIEDPSDEKSLRLATIMSTVAMSLPCSLLAILSAGAMISSARDAYQVTGIAIIFFFILLPFPGILGWLTGRGIAWILGP